MKQILTVFIFLIIFCTFVGVIRETDMLVQFIQYDDEEMYAVNKTKLNIIINDEEEFIHEGHVLENTAIDITPKSEVSSIYEVINENRLSRSKTKPYWKWNNVSGEGMFDFDALDCHDLVWRPGLTWRRVNLEEQKVAISIVASKMTLNYVSVLVKKVHSIRRVSDVDIIIIVLNSGTTPFVLKQLQKQIPGNNVSKHLMKENATVGNVKVLARDLNFKKSDLGKNLINKLKKNMNCCGVDEYIKLEVFNLPYDRVLFIDNDLNMLKSPDILFKCDMDIDLMYAAGPWTPLNAGMFIAKPNRSLYLHMIETLKNVSRTFKNKYCFKGLGCGPCRRPSERPCAGAEGPQGYFHYYFIKREDPNLIVRQISTCIFDFLYGRHDVCRKEFQRSLPYFIHKGFIEMQKTYKLGDKLIDDVPSTQICPDFLILSDKASSKYASTLLKNHFNFQLIDNVFKYKKQSNHSLVGAIINLDIINTRNIIKTCGHKYTKFLIFLNDPIENCILQKQQPINQNISNEIWKDVREFQTKVNGTGWVRFVYPRFDKIKTKNCVVSGIYIAQIKRWLYHASITNTRIYFLEHLQKAEAIRDVVDFIGVSEKRLQNFTSNTNIQKPSHSQNITIALRQELENTFAPYNRILEEYLKINLPWCHGGNS